jgi:CRISPR-associated protein Csd2
MTDAIYTDPSRRHDFVLLFDVTDGNPNGDPDAGNLPRIDPETMQGLVTDVCLKRKVRNWVDATRGGQERYKIYVQNRGIALNDLHQRAYTKLAITSTGSKQKREDVDRARSEMCANFFDIRTFGAVMTTRVNYGQVRGPVQMTFARSIDPVIPLDPTFKGVWHAAVNFAPLPLLDTRPDQCPQLHRRADDGPGRHGPGGLSHYP